MRGNRGQLGNTEGAQPGATGEAGQTVGLGREGGVWTEGVNRTVEAVLDSSKGDMAIGAFMPGRKVTGSFP